MKEKFTKAAYIQDRSHVFIGHFGAETFSYEISEAEHIEGWRAAKGEKSFKSAYKFEVTQMYTGKYGKFSFIQEVYVLEPPNTTILNLPSGLGISISSPRYPKELCIFKPSPLR